MRPHLATFVAVLLAPVLLTAQGTLGTYEDRIAVEDVMARYVWRFHGLIPSNLRTFVAGSQTFPTANRRLASKGPRSPVVSRLPRSLYARNSDAIGIQRADGDVEDAAGRLSVARRD